ncbi:PREDICTED: putative odorant receptor 92a [Eufriesea mexicana]|uniref:putative odorant receptor 92a n=1 Tax=Eufriesea mexicana TaxID=516756 RepID=UPI00083C8E5D|nr:PREDICTED: putative odorant receptor 92a [Eufriesea mexicana]
MLILRWTLKLFIASGYHPPLASNCPKKRFLYNIYMVVVISFIWTFVATLIFDAIYNVGNQNDLCENIGVTITTFITSLKMLNLAVKRKTIESLLNILEHGPFMPVDAKDKKIFTKFEKQVEKLTILYTVQIMSYVACTLVVTAINFKYQKLPHRVWLPFDCTSSWLLYSLIVLHQIISITVTCIAIIVSDTLFAGLLLHICCQFELLEHRLKNIEGDKIGKLKRCARHHKLIYSYSKKVNDLFSAIMCLQFVASASGMCFNLYRMTQVKVGSQTIDALIYILCGLVQSFFFCWHGDIAKSKSLEIPNIIFHSNWPVMSKDAKRILLIIMTRSLIPVQITSAYVLPMDLESFKGLIKAIYSAYNMLQQTK